MGCQFIHIESYARKAGKGKYGGHSIRSIIAEADREPGAHPHVEHPKPPFVVFGVGLNEVEAQANDYAEHSKDAIGRKLRSDAPVLLAGVISAPPDFSDEQWNDLKILSVEALKDRYGDRLKSVIEHTDESKRHVHFYAVPQPGERFDQMHTGRGRKAQAEAEAKEQGLSKSEINKAGNVAYKAEMRAFQKWFHDEVGSRLGLTLLGPQRRRLTRVEWHAEQAAAEAIATARKNAEQKITEASSAIEAAKTIQVSVKKEIQEVEVAKISVDFEKQILEERKKDIAKEAEKIQTEKIEVVKVQQQIQQERVEIKQERAELEAEKSAWRKISEKVGSAFGWALDVVTGKSRKIKLELEEIKKKADLDKRVSVEMAVEKVKSQRDQLANQLQKLQTEVDSKEKQERLERKLALDAKNREKKHQQPK